jgi:ATP-dependent DNA ligase
MICSLFKAEMATSLSANFPEIEELTKLAKNVVVDGEIVIMRNGKVNFHALQERGHLISGKDIDRMQTQSPATYILVNILEKDGKPAVDLPLTERKGILKEFLNEGLHVIINCRDTMKTKFDAKTSFPNVAGRRIITPIF